MSNTLHLRAATPDDLSAITTLLEELSAAENTSTQANASTLAGALFPPSPPPIKLRALVAERGNVLVGILLYYGGYDTHSASYGYHLADMVVTAKSRSEGIGQRLYSALAEQCLREGSQWISLTVLKENQRAQAFYTHVGMQQVPVDFYAIGPKGLKAL